MESPLPSMLNARLIEVAVVLSLVGNHWLEIKGGAAMMVTPEIPLSIAQMWQLDQNLLYICFRLFYILNLTCPCLHTNRGIKHSKAIPTVKAMFRQGSHLLLLNKLYMELYMEMYFK